MRLHLLRISGAKESTLGWIFIDGKPEAMTLEDQFQNVKVKHETRIPAGKRYDVGFNENITPMTERYRKRFTWFTYHLEIKEVKGFENIYIHLGNDDDDTSGCVLVGDSQTNNQYQDGFLGNSAQAFERFYKKVFTALKAGDEVTIDVEDYRA